MSVCKRLFATPLMICLVANTEVRARNSVSRGRPLTVRQERAVTIIAQKNVNKKATMPGVASARWPARSGTAQHENNKANLRATPRHRRSSATRNPHHRRTSSSRLGSHAGPRKKPQTTASKTTLYRALIVDVNSNGGSRNLAQEQSPRDRSLGHERLNRCAGLNSALCNRIETQGENRQ